MVGPRSREEIVGKRFLSVSSQSKINYRKIHEWSWRSGFVRAVSHRDYNHPDLNILIEFDDSDWRNRDWYRLYIDEPFAVFLVENTLVWTPRTDASCSRNFYWPSLTFKPLVDNAAFSETPLQPVEFLIDKELGFVNYRDLLCYEDEDEYATPFREFSEIEKAVKQWSEYQDGQRILTSTPSILVGYRVAVYRVEGTTRWYTAVVISYNDDTRELTLTDDTVLEEHCEDPALVQMKLIGDGVVSSIIKGETVGKPRQRACTKKKLDEEREKKLQSLVRPVHYCTRTRSHPGAFFNANHRLNRLPGRKVRHRVLNASATKSSPDNNSDESQTASTSKPSTSTAPYDTVSTQTACHSQQHQSVGDDQEKTEDTADTTIEEEEDIGHGDVRGHGKGAGRCKGIGRCKGVKHCRYGRKQSKRQKQLAKPATVTSNSEFTEYEAQCSELTAKSEEETVQEKEEKAKQVSDNSNGPSQSDTSPSKSEIAPKLLLSIKPVKEPDAKDGGEDHSQEKLGSVYSIPSTSKREWTVSAICDNRDTNITFTEVSDIDKYDNIAEYDDGSNSPIDKALLSVSPVSGTPAVLTDISLVEKSEINTDDDSDSLTVGGDNSSDKVVGDLIEGGEGNFVEGSADSHFAESSADSHFAESSADNHFAESGADNHFAESGADNHFAESSAGNHFAEGSDDNHFVEGSDDNHFVEGGDDSNCTEGGINNSFAEQVDSLGEEVENSNRDGSAIFTEKSPKQEHESNSQPYETENSESECLLPSSESEFPDSLNASDHLPEPTSSDSTLVSLPIVIRRFAEVPVVSENSSESSGTHRSLPDPPIKTKIIIDLPVTSNSLPVSPATSKILSEASEVNDSFQELLETSTSLPNSSVVCETAAKPVIAESFLEPVDLVVKVTPKHSIDDKPINSLEVNRITTDSFSTNASTLTSAEDSIKVLETNVINVSIPETFVVNQSVLKSPVVGSSSPKSPVLGNTQIVSSVSPNLFVVNENLPNLPVVSKSLPNSLTSSEQFDEPASVVSESTSDSSVVRIKFSESPSVNKGLPKSSVVSNHFTDSSITSKSRSSTLNRNWAETEKVNKDLFPGVNEKPPQLPNITEPLSQPFDLRSVLKSSAQEPRQRDFALTCAKTGRAGSLNSDHLDFSPNHLKSETSHIKDNITRASISQSISNLENFPKVFDPSGSIKQEFPVSVNGIQEGRFNEAALIYDPGCIKREKKDHEAIPKYSYNSFPRALPESHHSLKWKQEGDRLSNPSTSGQNLLSERKHHHQRNVIVNAAQHKHGSYKSASLSQFSPQGHSKNFGIIPGTESRHASSIAKNDDTFYGARVPGMSHLGKVERNIEKSSNPLHSGPFSTSNYKFPHVVNDRRALSLRAPEPSISKERSRSEERRNADNLQVDHYESVRLYRDPRLVNNGPSIHHVDYLHHRLMHPAGISHSAAAAAAAAVYPRVATLPQHTRNSGAPIPSSPLGPYSLSSHLLPPPHVSGAPAAAGAPPGSHMEQHAAAMHSQAYRHLMSPHPLMPPQYGGTSGPHVGLDLMWQQKYNPNPWMMAQYEEGLRLERERAIAQERERTRIERDQRDDMERADREKVERDKIEKERVERERIQKEQQRQDRERMERERMDRERVDREERERVQREAVQQHFEESLRHMHKPPHLQKSVGWSPMSSLSLGKTQSGLGRSSPTVSQSLQPSDHDRDKVREKEKERISAMEARMRHEHERWLATVQRSDPNVAHSSSQAPNYSPVESRSSNNQAKHELYSMSRVSPHAVTNVGHHSSKPGIVPSPIVTSPTVSNVPVSQHKSETNFSLYGYQPFQHTYITQAQLKAREEAKGSNNMQPMIVSGNKQAALNTAKDKETIYERPSTPGNNRTSTPIGSGNSTKQLKLVNQGHERSSPMYQPLVGSGGAFKPYEYSNTSPAPPAHQSSSSPTIAARINTPHFLHSQQEQPQNLVKSDHKVNHDESSGSIPNHQRYESRDARQALSTPPTSIPSSYTPPYSNSKSTSPASSTSYSYNLIQQGLVPNPLYMASTHSGSSPALNISATACNQQSKSSSANSPPISQQFPRAASGSGITSGTPVCRSGSLSYPSSQSKGSHNYSPLGHTQAINTSKTCPQEAHAGSRLHVQSTGSNHGSPSPAHIYGSVPSLGIHAGLSSSANHSMGSSSSPRLNTSISSSQVQTMHRMPIPPTSNTVSISPPQSALTDKQVLPLNLQGNSPNGKRKSAKEVNPKKRQKTSEDLLPPQLHPQIVHAAIDTSVQQIGTPPNIVSNPLSSVRYLGGSVLSSPSALEGSPSQPSTKPESLTTAMPELHYSSAMSSGNPNMSAFIDSYRSFVNTPQESQGFGIKHKVLNKPAVENSVLDASELPGRPLGNVNSSAGSILTIPTIIVSQDGADENRMTISPASSASSTLTSGSGTSGSINHTKLKKAWLQRHSENEDKKTPSESIKADSPTKAVELEDHKETIAVIPSTSASNLVGEEQTSTVKTETGIINGPAERSSKSDAQQEDSTSSASETEEAKYVKRKLRISRKQGSPSPSIKKTKVNSSTPEASTEESQPLKKEKESNKKKILSSEKDAAFNSKRRGRKTKGKNTASEDESKKKPSKPVEKPSVAQLKKTGEPFLQDGPCCEVAPRLPKCRECRMTPHQRSKKMPNIFCRFYAFRKLRYGKSGTILSAGFSEPSDATDDDLKLWLPPIESAPSDTEVETSKFLLTHVGDQFCDLVEMEREAQALHMSESTIITWKRVVQGVREMCDVCETTLFNIHWVCHKCGFVVCIDCYKTRKNGFGKGEDLLAKDRDEFQWLLCTNRQPHEQDKLMITQIIASTALWDVGKTLHDVRRRWNIPTYCNCILTKDGDQDGKHSTNGICKLMSAVTKCFSSEKDSNQVNGLNESSRHSKKSKGSSVNGVKQDDGISGYSSESGGSPLSWLADVALNSSSKGKGDKNKSSTEDGDDDKLSDNQSEQADGFAESDDEKNENFSTLRELLIRPMGKMGGKHAGTDSSSQKTLTSTLDEVISCVIEQRVRKPDGNCQDKQLLHFTRRHETLRSGRELLPIRSCTITESSLLYPETPHFWLGGGKILLLTDPYHSGNMQMFQEQWKRGQPVIVADVGQHLDESLWSPDSFIRDFGDDKNDFLNCLCGTLVQNQPMRRFWEGFENLSKRMKDEDGQNMVLKLKDWPPSEEFSELLPARFQDLMKVLPLPDYTNRDGMFNMASRLPDCFVRPDLGPRMYNAYGLAPLCNKGSTNLHLDVSDSLNILVYVSDSSEDPDLKLDISRVIDESGCDSLMKKRSLEDNSKIGAIWHIYNARDADKIRDLLNKVAEEQGANCDPHHDPIHNQEWYLDAELRERLLKEYNVKGYVIVQNVGDAIFIPAGSPHQVRNVKSCIKISEDFVSPESVAHCFFLTQEMRNLPDGPINHEDKLQIKNIIYHAVKDALALLQSCDPEDSKS